MLTENNARFEQRLEMYNAHGRVSGWMDDGWTDGGRYRDKTSSRMNERGAGRLPAARGLIICKTRETNLVCSRFICARQGCSRHRVSMRFVLHYGRMNAPFSSSNVSERTTHANPNRGAISRVSSRQLSSDLFCPFLQGLQDANEFRTGKTRKR